MNPRKTSIISISSIAGLLAGGVFLAAPASAHGYVNAPESRSYLCKTGVNTDCGGVQYEPQSLEYLKGYPAGGPADGQIASAGGQFGGKLDEQSATRWAKSDIRPGPMLFDWTYTAPHSTAKWHYYMTKQGWDQNSPLDRADFELIGEVQHDGSKASNNPDHVIDVPANRSGYHVILAVWDVADTVNAFYNVIDVNVINDGQVDVTAPTAPMHLHSMGETPTSVDLMWTAATDEVGVVSYRIYQDGQLIGTTPQTELTVDQLDPETAYSFSVSAVDAAGNESGRSTVLAIATPAAVIPEQDVTAPTAPTNLHSMGETQTSIDLMWGASTDDVGVTIYRIYRDGEFIRSTSMMRAMDTGLTAGTTYRYTVTAVDAAGNESAVSNTLVKTTKAAPAPAPAPDPTPEPTPVASGTWNDRASYVTGDLVTFGGTTYRAVQSHTGVGDPNWIHALSLWAPVADAPAVDPTPAPTPEPVPSTAWSATASYVTGDVVTFGGTTYRAVQSHTGVGDPNWIYAPSLWSPVG